METTTFAEREAAALIASECEDNRRALANRVDEIEELMTLHEREGEAGAAEMLWAHTKTLLARIAALS